MKEYNLEHFDERKTKIDMLVLHSIAFDSVDAVKCLDNLKLSSHYILTNDGEILKLVKEENRAWHAGKSYWKGLDQDLNSRSIGIEVCSPSLGQSLFSEKQLAKLIPFCQKIIRKYKIAPEMVVGHSDIAPLTKADPGVAFPWKKLAKEGVGLWYQPKNAIKMVEDDVVKLLDVIGYDTRGLERTKASAYAFCRRFLPQYVAVDNDIGHLVDHVLPENFNFIEEEKFLQTLKAVAYSYQNAKESRNPCRI